MIAPDPYAMHALLLVYGCDRAEIVRKLREHADAIARGDDGRFSVMPGAEGLCVVREAWEGQEAGGAGEEAGACRMHAVYSDSEGASASDPIAMFADEGEAREYAASSHADRCVIRADVAISAWNSLAPDPHASEGA